MSNFGGFSDPIINSLFDKCFLSQTLSRNEISINVNNVISDFGISN